MAVNNNFPYAPENVTLEAGYIRLLKQAINYAMKGKTNNTGEVTLTANAASTPVTEKLCTENSVVLLQPLTANAAAALGTTYITAGAGTFTITHANNSQVDKSFKYVIIG